MSIDHVMVPIYFSSFCFKQILGFTRFPSTVITVQFSHDAAGVSGPPMRSRTYDGLEVSLELLDAQNDGPKPSVTNSFEKTKKYFEVIRASIFKNMDVVLHQTSLENLVDRTCVFMLNHSMGFVNGSAHSWDDTILTTRFFEWPENTSELIFSCFILFFYSDGLAKLAHVRSRE